MSKFIGHFIELFIIGINSITDVVLLLATLLAVCSCYQNGSSSVLCVFEVSVKWRDIKFRAIALIVNYTYNPIGLLSNTCLPSSRHLNTYNVANKSQVIIDLMCLSSSYFGAIYIYLFISEHTITTDIFDVHYLNIELAV